MFLDILVVKIANIANRISEECLIQETFFSEAAVELVVFVNTCVSFCFICFNLLYPNFVDLPRVMDALKKADSFLDRTLTEKCKVRMDHIYLISTELLHGKNFQLDIA